MKGRLEDKGSPNDHVLTKYCSSWIVNARMGVAYNWLRVPALMISEH